MKKKRSLIIRTSVFLAVFAILFWGLNRFVQPVWKEWNNQDTIQGFYEEPKNRIETVFVGASMMIGSISPTEIYEDYGICSYNLGTQQQPVSLSYFWTKEAYRLHGETMKTVVMDVSMIRRVPKDKVYRKGLDGMHLSSVKLEAIKALADDRQEYWSFLFPVISYHDRWQSLNELDFEKFLYQPMDYMRGYLFELDQIFDKYEYDDMPIPLQIADEGVETANFDEYALVYFDKLAKFCAEKDLQLLLIKTPSAGGWDSSEHNRAQALADEYGLTFLDFEVSPLFEECGYNAATDAEDSVKHSNYFGARKVTSRLGAYLADSCSGTDVRGNEKYAYMDRQVEQYHEKVTAVMDLKTAGDPVTLLQQVAESSYYSACVLARGDVGEGLNEGRMEDLCALGLKQLKDIDSERAYYGIISSGNVQTERILNTEIMMDEEVLLEAAFPDETEFSLIWNNRLQALIAGETYGKKSKGLQVIVYDHVLHEVVEDAFFPADTAFRYGADLEADLRCELDKGTDYTDLPPDLKKLYLYNVRADYSRTAKLVRLDQSVTAICSFLETYMNQEDLVILICGRTGENTALPEEVSCKLTELGFFEWGKLKKGMTYAAVWEDGSITEKTGSGKKISLAQGAYEITGSPQKSSIRISGEEYAPELSAEENGFSIVVYDLCHKMVADRYIFSMGQQ